MRRLRDPETWLRVVVLVVCGLLDVLLLGDKAWWWGVVAFLLVVAAVVAIDHRYLGPRRPRAPDQVPK